MEKVKAKKKKVNFDLQKLEGDENAAMAKMYEDTLKNFTEGSIVKGKVLEVRPTEILVDIGYKSGCFSKGSKTMTAWSFSARPRLNSNAAGIAFLKPARRAGSSKASSRAA
jgi:hypothetical protein